MFEYVCVCVCGPLQVIGNGEITILNIIPHLRRAHLLEVSHCLYTRDVLKFQLQSTAKRVKMTSLINGEEGTLAYYASDHINLIPNLRGLAKVSMNK